MEGINKSLVSQKVTLKHVYLLEGKKQQKKSTHTPNSVRFHQSQPWGQLWQVKKKEAFSPPPFFFFFIPWEKEKDDGKFNKSMTRGKKTQKTKKERGKKEREREGTAEEEEVVVSWGG